MNHSINLLIYSRKTNRQSSKVADDVTRLQETPRSANFVTTNASLLESKITSEDAPETLLECYDVNVSSCKTPGHIFKKKNCNPEDELARLVSLIWTST